MPESLAVSSAASLAMPAPLPEPSSPEGFAPPPPAGAESPPPEHAASPARGTRTAVPPTSFRNFRRPAGSEYSLITTLRLRRPAPTGSRITLGPRALILGNGPYQCKWTARHRRPGATFLPHSPVTMPLRNGSTLRSRLPRHDSDAVQHRNEDRWPLPPDSRTLPLPGTGPLRAPRRGRRCVPAGTPALAGRALDRLPAGRSALPRISAGRHPGARVRARRTTQRHDLPAPTAGRRYSLHHLCHLGMPVCPQHHGAEALERPRRSRPVDRIPGGPLAHGRGPHRLPLDRRQAPARTRRARRGLLLLPAATALLHPRRALPRGTPGVAHGHVRQGHARGGAPAAARLVPALPAAPPLRPWPGQDAAVEERRFCRHGTQPRA